MAALKARVLANDIDELPLPQLQDLPLTSEEKYAVSKFLEALGVDGRITCYGDIAETLSDLLENPPLHPATGREWATARKLINKLHSHDNMLRRWAGTSPQPLTGRFYQYPVLSCLLYHPSENQKEQIRLLKRLVLTGALLRNAGAAIPRDILYAAADEIRRASPAASDRASAIRNLRVTDASSSPLLSMLAAIQQCLTVTAKDTQAYRCLSAIQKLGLGVLNLPSRRANTDATRIPPEDVERVEGTIYVSDEAEPTLDSDLEPDEDVENATVFVEPESEPGDELSNRGLAASARASRYWLTRAQTGVLWDPGRISPAELPRLRNYLTTLTQRVHDEKVGAGQALVTALIAATGLDASLILRLRLGRDGDISETGQYWRSFSIPTSAFSPSEAVGNSFLQGHVWRIGFELPEVVVQLIKLTVSPTIQTAITLESLFAPEDRDKLTDLIGKDIRAAVSPRLTYRHLRTALRHEVYSQTGDPLLAYLIAGRTDQVPPVRLYYSAVVVSELQALQQRVICRLFGEP